jgi:membrane-bound lytic murein transglycosylase D
MTRRPLALYLFLLIFFTSSDPHFGQPSRPYTTAKSESDAVRELPWVGADSFKNFILDEDQRISTIFEVTPFFYSSVHFWFMIYSQFESTHVVIHDRENLNLIYKVLDFSSLKSKGLSRNILNVLQRKITEEKIAEIKSDLKYLSHNPKSPSAQAKQLLFNIRSAGLDIPKGKNNLSRFFNNLHSRLRSQTGQKDYIREGVIRSLPYKKFITNYFKKLNIPTELMAIAFLESSFNPRAESKVGALGAWQFMPLIGSYYLPRKNHLYDYRSNIALSTLAAGHLLKENMKIMKSIDLAVTAYNSGPKHLLRTRRELLSKNVPINLESVIKHSDSKHFGFASKNFYSEFLALTRVLSYEEELFDQIHQHDRTDVDSSIRFYMLKCSLKFKFNNILSPKKIDDILFHNHHLKDVNQTYLRGTIITAKTQLPTKFFLELESRDQINLKPKDWQKKLKNYSCSTR